MKRGNRLRTAADLSERYMGRTVTVAGITGTLGGLIPVGDRIQLALQVGGAQVYTDALPGGEHVEVWQQEGSPEARRG